MSIWVSRYSNKELQNGKFYPVGISIGKPKWSLGYEIAEQCFSLAPKGYMLNYEPDRFREAYFGKLDDIGEERIISTVSRLDYRAREEGKELVLLCFEDIRNDGEWCHRTMFAEWWAEHTGEIIEELPDPTPPRAKKPKPETKGKKPLTKPAEETTDNNYFQMSLFDL